MDDPAFDFRVSRDYTIDTRFPGVAAEDRGNIAGSHSALSFRPQSLLDSFVDEQANVHNSLLLIEGPGFKWKGASGMAVPESELSMLPDGQFNIDSIAKMMTATIVMKLVKAGELRLDDPICQYLPDALLNGLHVYGGRSYSEEITVQHLLTHTSDIADDWAHPEFLDLITADTQKRWTPEETVEFVKEKCQPRFPPDDGFEYSDPGYNLLGLIIEKLTGNPFTRSTGSYCSILWVWITHTGRRLKRRARACREEGLPTGTWTIMNAPCCRPL